MLPAKMLLGGYLPGLLISSIDSITSNIDIGRFQGGGPTSEDCLFLDVYVPGKALQAANSTKRVPVVRDSAICTQTP